MRQEGFDSLLVKYFGSVCYISDLENYEILYLTEAGEEACGLNGREDWYGKKCYKVLQGLDEPCPFCTNDRLEEGKELNWTHYNENLGAWFKLRDFLVDVEGRHCRLEIAQNVTAEKEETKRIEELLHVEEIILDCLRTLTKETDLDKAVRSFLEEISSYYGADRAYIFEFDREAGLIDNSFEWCRPGVEPEIDKLQRLPMEIVSDWVAKFWRDGEFFISSVEAMDHDSEDYKILEMQDIDSLLAAPLTDKYGISGFIGVDNPTKYFRDFTLLRAAAEFVTEELEKRRLMAELEHISYTDMLTGLKNRNRYIQTLKEYDVNPPGSLGVIFVDINGMKSLNDTYGHDYGDHIIKECAAIMKETLTGQLYRIGGDEFVAMCPDMPRAEFHAAVEKLRRACWDDENCDVSIGYVWKEGELDVTRQILQADELMYADKQSYYRAVLNHGRIARSGFANEVLQEIADKRFVVFYQPQVEIETGRIVGAEALVRKKGDNGELIAPDKFIPFYEVEGVVRHLDLHVIDTACAALEKWREEGNFLNLSVNCSRVTLMEQGIVGDIKAVCDKHGVPTSCVTIEVTESIGTMEYDQLRELMDRLTEAGFSVSLDDFGSRFSNLSILASMNFDEIKFDRTLISDLEGNRKSRVVLQKSIQMCRELDDTVTVAEGIETQGQVDLLLDFSCSYGQGYFFSKPVALEDFNSLLAENIAQNGKKDGAEV